MASGRLGLDGSLEICFGPLIPSRRFGFFWRNEMPLLLSAIFSQDEAKVTERSEAKSVRPESRCRRWRWSRDRLFCSCQEARIQTTVAYVVFRYSRQGSHSSEVRVL